VCKNVYVCVYESESVCVRLVCGVRDCHPQIRNVTNRKKNQNVA
jgi:hypothetical protein